MPFLFHTNVFIFHPLIGKCSRPGGPQAVPEQVRPQEPLENKKIKILVSFIPNLEKGFSEAEYHFTVNFKFLQGSGLASFNHNQAKTEGFIQEKKKRDIRN